MRSLRLYLIVGTVLVVIYIVAQLNRPKVIDWSPSFSDKEKAPFGTYILYNRLKDAFPDSKVIPYRKPVYSAIADDPQRNSSYLIICQAVELTKADYDQL